MRRTVLIALTVLALSVGVCAASAVSVERAVRGAEGLLQQSVQAARLGDEARAGQAAQALYAMWLERERVLELLTSHDALSEIRGGIEDALLCLERGEALEFARAMARVRAGLERLRMAEAVRLMNLF